MRTPTYRAVAVLGAAPRPCQVIEFFVAAGQRVGGPGASSRYSGRAAPV